MSSEHIAKECNDLPVFVAELDGSNNAATYSLTLKPVKAVNGVAQYWPLYNEGNKGEQFGNLLFKFNGKNGQFKLNISLDLSEVPNVAFVESGSGLLDGVVGLSPDFKHEFKSKAKKGPDGRNTGLEIMIKNKDSRKDPIAYKDIFAFLWQCENIETGMHFVSGDPEAQLEPQ